MKGVLLFFLMIVAAVFLGLVIAYWYLRRLDDNSGRVRKAARAIPFPDKHPPVDVTPTSPKLPKYQADAPGTSAGADIDGLMRRLGAIKAEQEQQAAPAEKARHQQVQPLRSNPDRDRDDLKRISGIGPKLEQLLNTNGIFHFRQIADWQDADIQAIDDLLPAFHGRIEREDWVEQARSLRDGE